jgi:hypothetical protein
MPPMQNQDSLPDLEAGVESCEETSSIAKGYYVSIRGLDWLPEDETEVETKMRLKKAVGIHKDYYGKCSR